MYDVLWSIRSNFIFSEILILIFIILDQPIPAGMHVRVNLQTGEREGKWLSKQNYQNDRDTSLIVTSDTDKLKKYDMNKLKYQHLENAIKNIPNEITADDDRVGIIYIIFYNLVE